MLCVFGNWRSKRRKIRVMWKLKEFCLTFWDKRGMLLGILILLYDIFVCGPNSVLAFIVCSYIIGNWILCSERINCAMIGKSLGPPTMRMMGPYPSHHTLLQKMYAIYTFITKMCGVSRRSILIVVILSLWISRQLFALMVTVVLCGLDFHQMESLVWKILLSLAIVVIAGITDVRNLEAIFIYFFRRLYVISINSFLYFYSQVSCILCGI